MGYGITGIPLSQCRGYETFNMNDYLVLVQSPINEAAQASSQIWTVKKWNYDVYGRIVDIADRGLLIFQFSNHSWTVLRELPTLISSNLIGEEEVANLSNLLRAKTMSFLISDTSGKIGYNLYEAGRLVEQFSFLYEEDEEDEEEFSDERPIGNYQFWSQQRQIQIEDIEDPYSFTYSFLQEQDAFAPYLFSRNSFQSGTQAMLLEENVERSDFIRMDYLAV